MKKIFAIIMAGLIMCAASVTAFAETTNGEDVSKDVKAKYVDGVVTPEVCSVDIAWGAMEFTYSESGTKTWNPQTHEYIYNTTSGWSVNGNTVSVTNHSNKAVKASLKFDALSEYSDKISGTFDKSEMLLESAESCTVENAPNASAALSLNGTVDSSLAEFTKVGSITVTLDN